jgi:hypothetical protein
MVGLTLKRLIVSLALCLGATAFSQTHPPTEIENGGLFLTSDQCIACHSNLTAHSGEDVSIGYSWRASMMANSARDPYWQAGVRRELLDHPEAQALIEDTCSTCHMPMMRFEAKALGQQGQVFANLQAPLAMDGVSCTVCHQIRGDNFGDAESFDGGFVIDTSRPAGERQIFGPHDVDGGRRRIMNSASLYVPAQSTHLQESELCGSCHTLYTQAVGSTDNNGQPVTFAEQMPYREWVNSDYKDVRSCQDCHMPELTEATPITSVLGEPRPRFSQHVFRGGNPFMIRMLNKYRGELGVTALPQELSNTARQTEAFLGTQSARVAIDTSMTGSVLNATVTIDNAAGHKLPTAYPSRRVWLHFTVTADDGSVVFESGALRADGSIAGNDNDDDAGRYEPHYERIERADQVQIYEPILVAQTGQLTTGLLSATRYIKDNRLLPTGLEKRTAPWDIAVHGAAVQDDSFVGGRDRIEYRVAVGNTEGPLTVSVELNYQSIGFRWAENLKNYAAPETERFVRYYAEMSDSSSVKLASSSARVAR